jgi:hypothetical protein
MAAFRPVLALKAKMKLSRNLNLMGQKMGGSQGRNGSAAQARKVQLGRIGKRQI